jgi:hypothetical protein
LVGLRFWQSSIQLCSFSRFWHPTQENGSVFIQFSTYNQRYNLKTECYVLKSTWNIERELNNLSEGSFVFALPSCSVENFSRIENSLKTHWIF